MVPCLRWGNSRAHSQKFDNVLVPRMAAFFNIDTNYTCSAELFRVTLHALHAKFACIVQGLSVVFHLDVATGSLNSLSHRLPGDVIYAVAHHQPKRAIA